MARAKRAAGKTRALTEELEADKAPASERGDPLDRLLDRVSPHAPQTPHAPHVPEERKRSALGKQLPAAPTLRMAQVTTLTADRVEVSFRGGREPVAAELGEGVDRELVAQAMKNRDPVLVEVDGEGAAPSVVGVVQARIPREVVIKAETVRIEADREILLRSNTAALRLREDGDVELVGGRILAASRGLFRLVGRVLRLN